MRAPSAALRVASPSSTASAIVFSPSFSLLALTISKKPSEIAGRGSGPTGSIEKYFGYLNSSLMSSANRLMKVMLCAITTGIAGAAILVA